MADNTKIEWADATISPLYGCTKVSPACENCYAERLAARMICNPGVSHLYARTVYEDGLWTGKLNLHPGRMEQALRWKKPRRIFVASQADLFHEDAPDDFIDPRCKRWDCTRLTKSGGCGWTCENMDDGNDVYMQRVGRTKAGRLLDGVEHNALPEVPHA